MWLLSRIGLARRGDSVTATRTNQGFRRIGFRARAGQDVTKIRRAEKTAGPHRQTTISALCLHRVTLRQGKAGLLVQRG